MSILSALTFDTKRVSKEGLKRLNLAVAVVLLLEAIAAFLMKASVEGAHSVQLSYLSKDAVVSQAAGQDMLLSASRHLFDVNILYLVILTFLLSAAAALLFSTRFKRKYDAQLSGGSNYLRWNSYCLSVGLLMLTAASFDGVAELMLLISVGLATGSLMLVAKNHEVLPERNGRGFRWANVMTILILVPLLSMAAVLYGSYAYGTTSDLYQYAVLLLSIVYLAWLALQSLKPAGPAKEYLRRERGYVLVNLVGVSLIGWLVVLGSLK